jgi:hypothetical protein
VADWFGPVADSKGLPAIVAQASGVAEVKESPRPAGLPAERPESQWLFSGTFSRAAADRAREELYVSFFDRMSILRFDGKTGELDKSWYPNGEFDGGGELSVGPDGLLYIGLGQKATRIIRVDHGGVLVPFAAKENLDSPGEKEPERCWPKALQWGFPKDVAGSRRKMCEQTWLVTCCRLDCKNHEAGMFLSPSGFIAKRSSEHVLANYDPKLWKRFTDKDKDKLMKPPGMASSIAIWDLDGKLVAWDAVPGVQVGGQGLAMDRDGSLYVAQGSCMPAGQGAYGLPGFGTTYRTMGGIGSVIKFRGQGGKYPLGKFVYGKEAPPADAVKLSDRSAVGALWAYGGVTGQSGGDCTCHHSRFDLDSYARLWIPASYLCSIVVLDTNGNPILRIGRYGNVDDNDPKCGGIHFVWPRGVAASDTAMYALDHGNLRILKAALSYAAEEIAPAP